DLEDQILLAHAGGAGDVLVLGNLRELLDAQVLQVVEPERLARRPGRLAAFARRAGGCAVFDRRGLRIWRSRWWLLRSLTLIRWTAVRMALLVRHDVLAG